MVVPPYAIKQFLERDLYDSNAAKSFPKKAVRKLYLADKIKTTYKAYHHQMVCELLGRTHRGWGFFIDMGAGKTKITLDLFEYRRKRKEAKRMLVLVPGQQNMYEWVEQIREHMPHMSYTVIDQSGKPARMEAINKHADVTIATYAGWNWLVSSSPKKVTFVHSVARKVEGLFQFVVWDEASMLTNHTSTFWRAAHRLSRRGIFRYPLTATPTNKKLEAYWPLIQLVDDGETFGDSYTFFREVFFNKKKRPFGKWSYEYTFDNKKVDVFKRMLRSKSISYDIDECVDMPKLVGGVSSKGGLLIHRCVAPEETWKRYESVHNAMVAARGDTVEVKRSYRMMRSLASGWMPYTDVEGRKGVFVFENNPKMDVLLEILRGFPDESTIVFHHYNITGRVIVDALNKAGIHNLHVYGKNTAKVNRENVAQFKAGNVPVLVSSSVGAYGLNMHKASRREVFYETFESSQDRIQAERRVWRPGQQRRCFIHDICMHGTLDERSLAANRDGKNLLDLILKDGLS